MKNRIALLLTLAVIGGGVIAGTAFAAAGQATPQTVTVLMTDYKFKFVTKTPIKAGIPIVFKTVNKGVAPHNLDFQRLKKASKVIPGGKTANLTVTFSKAGRYDYVCAVPRHAQLGMAGTLVVK